MAIPPLSLDTLSSRPTGTVRPPRRVPAWLLPLGILAGFCLLFLALFGDRLLPAPKVDVALVLASASDRNTALPDPGESRPPEGNPLFQASGWIEPAPLPVKATALIDGVVESVAVLPGQTVEKGDLLATLISEDARLALATAEQNHRTRISESVAHRSAISAAKKKLGGLTAGVSAAATLRDEAADRIKRLEQLPAGAVSQADVVTAKLRRDREESQYLAAISAVGEAEAEVERLEAESRVREDDVASAALEVEKATLALSRTRITAPTDGRILRLMAAPGQKKMLQDQDAESSTIAILYRPAELQVRVDVPLADAAGLQAGQEAKIRCSLLPEKEFRGKVTLISGEADLQRNTLQAKVSIDDPVDELRPEMLCRVEFLETSDAGGTALPRASGSLAVWVPEASLADAGVWVCDPESKRVTHRTVKTTTESRDAFVRVTEGVRPGEWVVLSPAGLGEGQRVTPTLREQ